MIAQSLVERVGNSAVPRSSDLVELFSAKSPDKIVEFWNHATENAQRFRNYYQARYPGGSEPQEPFIIRGAKTDWSNDWMERIGVSVIGELTRDAIEIARAAAEWHSPGHDARHLIFKGPLAALRVAEEGHIADYRLVFLPLALLHDVGRVLEPLLIEKVPNFAEAGHPVLGYEIARRLLVNRPDLPQIIRDDMLNAVLEHEGCCCRTSAVAQLLQAINREQLIGPEFVARAIPFYVDRGGSLKPEWDLSARAGGDRHVLQHIHSFARNEREPIGAAAEMRAVAARAQSLAFCCLAAPLAATRFFAEFAEGKMQGGPLVSRLIQELRGFSALQQDNDFQQGTTNSLRELAFECCHPRLAADLKRVGVSTGSGTVWDRITAELDSLTPVEQNNYARAFRYINSRRELADRHDAPLIKEMLQKCYAGTAPYRIAAFTSETAARERRELTSRGLEAFAAASLLP